MNSAQMDDLKQFIDTTVINRVTEIVDHKLDARLIPLERRLSAKIDDLARSVAESIDASNDANDRWLRNHERRILKLESRPT